MKHGMQTDGKLYNHGVAVDHRRGSSRAVTGSRIELPRDCRTCKSSANFNYGAEACDKGFLPSFGDRCGEWAPSGELTTKQKIKERIIHFLSVNSKISGCEPTDSEKH